MAMGYVGDGCVMPKNVTNLIDKQTMTKEHKRLHNSCMTWEPLCIDVSYSALKTFIA